MQFFHRQLDKTLGYLLADKMFEKFSASQVFFSKNFSSLRDLPMQNRLLGLIAHRWGLTRTLKHVFRGRRVEAYLLVVFLVARCFCNSQKMAKNNRIFFEKFGHNFSAVNFSNFNRQFLRTGSIYRFAVFVVKTIRFPSEI